MQFLLDTHIWLWSVAEPKNLSKTVAKEIESPESELWLSPISVWETIVLTKKGRIKLDEEIEIWTSRALRSLSMKEAPVTIEIAREVGRVQSSNNDLADNFIIATARVMGLTLITSDLQLLKTAGLSVLSNR